jgi:branched-chain amino acid transport system substrate-binding protein
MLIKALLRAGLRACLAGLAIACAAIPALAADPIKVGFSMALTGAVAPNGKQLLLALEIWRDDVNAKGGLLGRPVELVYYDDQSNPSNVPGIYTKLLTVDKVDLVLGPYATNMIAAAMPVLMQSNKTTIGMLGVNINRQFNYPRYFSMIPGGDEGTLAFSRGWFDRGGAEPCRRRCRRRPTLIPPHHLRWHRENAKAGVLRRTTKAIHRARRSSPPSCARSRPQPGSDLRCAYPPDTVGRGRHRDRPQAKMAGAMVGLFATPIKMQLGPLMNGLVFMESFVPSPKLTSPGLKDLLAKYQARAPELKIDPLGYGYIPFGYGAGQVLAQAVEGTKSLDHEKLADYIHANAFQTVAGEIRFGKDGEWAKSRQFITQFQNITGNDLDQFRDTSHQVILWPAEYKTGDMIYPYNAAKKKP